MFDFSPRKAKCFVSGIFLERDFGPDQGNTDDPCAIGPARTKKIPERPRKHPFVI